jgi:hypothetical protein
MLLIAERQDAIGCVRRLRFVRFWRWPANGRLGLPAVVADDDAIPARLALACQARVC